MGRPDHKRIRWVGSSLADLRGLPEAPRRVIGRALWDSQLGRKSPAAKPLHGFGGASVLEIVADDDGSTYRAVYTVRFGEYTYVLHVFQKKSKTGFKTPAHEIALVRRRLKVAERDYRESRGGG